MLKDIIRGPVYVVGDNLDTDQMIPARHLVYSLSDPEERTQYGRYAMSGVPDAQAGLPHGRTPFVADGRHASPYRIILAGRNFGCGSSREHAPVALQIAGIEAIVAEFYARIFYRNAVDGGFFVPFESETRLIERIVTGEEVEIRVKDGTLTRLATGERYQLKPLGEVAAILEAGDVFAYARQSGFLK